jgi:hypothetical protein
MREPAESDRGVIDAARGALFEITEPESVGAVAGLDDSVEGVVDVFFVCTLPGYPSWRWNVSVSTVEGVDSPSVLEAELLPSEGALLAPDWVPWVDRLAEYRAAQAEAGEELVVVEGVDSLEGLDDDDDDDLDDESDDEDDESDDADDDDDDDDDETDDEADLLDTDDDIDGVDIDAHADDEHADDDDSDDDDDDSDDDDSDDEFDDEATADR